ncbi:TPA: hypothetical protein ACKPW3_001685 [Stenotrophomonas maltophilia]|uniref:hypothetical protein n=2 Tax=Pseudomonadota TaxID=1224 RepID=UPI00117C8F0D|nr:hypothetical protein [Stenotrophomonas maltophilia]MBH1523649.1 hypothetical protein [Stenotrophomonas maltophilia]MBH1648669.1 hypothetical protein [Stenotrophomonas maltophilia]MBH1754144.1 hypothetical protein [Stenotrophomonas maltophilia]MBH1811753.1 hypothetical protein [Stenotrophomonas maltophilia]MBH1889615.1 hypothetical protein [Stenotrophomonas maltophilia]
MTQAKLPSTPPCCLSAGSGFRLWCKFNARFDRSRIASCLNLSHVIECQLRDVPSTVPVVISGRTGQGGRIRKYRCPVVDQSHGYGQVSGNGMADVVETIAERFSHLKASSEYSAPDPAPEARIHLELLLRTRSPHGLQSRAEGPVGEPNLGSNLEENQQPLSTILVGAGIRLLGGDLYRQVRGFIGRSPQSDRYTSKAICLAAKAKSGNTEENRSNDRDSCDNYRPSIPPHDAAVDPQARARTKAIPPAHSLIPLWPHRNSAMPRQRVETVYG